MSCLRVNLTKSVLIAIGEVPELLHLVHSFDYEVKYLPSYLGLPLGASYKGIAVWEPVMERPHKRLKIEALI